MTGEMSRAEVTGENFPGLFSLQAALASEGIESDPRPFDQYQGPYLYVPGRGKVWYAPEDAGETFIIETRRNGKLMFETEDALTVYPQTRDAYAYGVYDEAGAVERLKVIR